MKRFLIYLSILIAGGILLSLLLLSPKRIGIMAPDGTKHYVPEEIVAAKDCAGFNKWRDSLVRPGFVPVQDCPWAPPRGPIAHFLVKYINFTIPREYLYLGSRDPDGPADHVYVEFKYPSMEAAKQNLTKVVGADNITTKINVTSVACMPRGKCGDLNLKAFQLKAQLNQYDMFKSNPPSNEEESMAQGRECGTYRKLCMNKFEQPKSKAYDAALREWDDKVEKCRLEYDVCRANPLIKIKEYADWGLVQYKYDHYRPKESLYIDMKDDQLHPKYWLFCVESPDGTRTRCNSQYDMGALGIDYRFDGTKNLANHRDVRDKLTKKIISLVNPEDVKHLDIKE